MYLEIERKLYTIALGALAPASMLVLTLWYPVSTKTFMQLARSIDKAKAWPEVVSYFDFSCSEL